MADTNLPIVRRRPPAQPVLPKKHYFPSQQIKNNPVDPNKLTIKQQAFVNIMANIDSEGNNLMSQAQAAIQAGYAPKHAHVRGCQLMKDPRITNAITEKLAQKFKRFDITPENILQELAALAMANKADFYDETGRLINVKQLPRHVSAALAGVDVQMTINELGQPAVVQKIKLHDKTRALELLGKNLKLFTDKMEVGPPEQMQASHDEKARATRARMLAALREEPELTGDEETNEQQAPVRHLTHG